MTYDDFVGVGTPCPLAAAHPELNLVRIPLEDTLQGNCSTRHPATSPLQTETTLRLNASLNAYGQRSSKGQQRGLDDLVTTMVQMAERTCQDVFHLSSLDPGNRGYLDHEKKRILFLSLDISSILLNHRLNRLCSSNQDFLRHVQDHILLSLSIPYQVHNAKLQGVGYLI